MANGISKNPLTDIGKVYLTQIAEGRLNSLEKASVLAMSDKPEDQDKAREIKTRYDYQSLMKQKKAKKAKVTEERSDWRHDLREIIVTADKDPEEPEIKEKKIKNKITINPKFSEAVEDIGGKLLTVEEVEQDDKKAEQMKNKEKMLKKRMLMMKLRAVQQTGGEDVVAGYEPERDMVEAKYEAGASTYGKASIRNKRRFGTKGENPDPLTGKKITKDATRGELITKRREEHKAKRGVKEEVGVSTAVMMDRAKKEAMLRKKERDAVAKKLRKEERDEYGDPVGGPKISKKQKEKNLKANTPDEQHTTTTAEGYGSDRVGPALKVARAIDKVNPRPKPNSKRTRVSRALKLASIKKDEKIRKREENPYSADKRLKMVATSIRDRVKQKAKAMTTREDYIPEEGYDIARDMGRVKPSKDKKDGTTMPPSPEMKKTQKVNKGPSAFERVKKKYGKAVMVVGKK